MRFFSWLRKRTKEIELPYNKEYYDKNKDKEFVPCIYSGKMINRHHSIITRDGFVSREEWERRLK